MASPNLVPTANNEGRLGKSGTQWSEVRGQTIYQNGNQVANLASPALTGTPTAPTQVTGDDSTKIATTAWVRDYKTAEALVDTAALVAGNLPEADDTTTLTDSGWSATDLRDRTNHTGTQTLSTISDAGSAATLGVTGADTDAVTGTAGTSGNLAMWNADGDAVDSTAAATLLTNATSAATPSTIVERDAQGAAQFATGNATSAIESNSTSGYAVEGNNTNTNGIAGYFSATGANSGVGMAANGKTGVSGYSSVSGGAGGSFSAIAGSVPVLGAGDSGGSEYIYQAKRLPNTTLGGLFDNGVNLILRLIRGSIGSLTTAALTADRTWTLPNASGTLVTGTGDGVTPTSFATSIGLGTADNAEFTTVQVATSISDGVRFGANAKLVMENAADTTNWQLPTGGGATETLVDGDGRGVTDAAAFRTAIGAGSSAIAAADITDSTATGQAAMTAANAAALRTAAGIDQDVSSTGSPTFVSPVFSDVGSSSHHSLGEMHVSSAAASGAITATTYLNALANATTADPGNTTSDFTISASGRITYTGSQTRLVSTSAALSFISTESNAIARFRFAKNGTTDATTEVARKISTGADVGALAIQGCFSLVANDYLELFCTLDSISGTDTITVNKCNMHAISL